MLTRFLPKSIFNERWASGYYIILDCSWFSCFFYLNLRPLEETIHKKTIIVIEISTYLLRHVTMYDAYQFKVLEVSCAFGSYSQNQCKISFYFGHFFASHLVDNGNSFLCIHQAKIFLAWNSLCSKIV